MAKSVRFNSKNLSQNVEMAASQRIQALTASSTLEAQLSHAPAGGLVRRAVFQAMEIFQMRNKHAMKLLGIVMAGAGALLNGPAGAESEPFCRDYAQRAVRAFQQKNEMGQCFPEGPPGRWQANLDNHFNWCRVVPAIWARRETELRENQLRVCRREPKAVGCREYAINANSSQTSNLSGRCGFTGARWQNNFDNHFMWCLPTAPEIVNHESNIRFAMLGVCGRQQEPFVRCDGYARHAVAQVNEANSRRCGFGGARWTPVYEDHLSWCIGVPAGFANSETSQREGPLSQCRTTHPVGAPLPPPEACLASVIVRNKTCLNVDGTASSIVPGSVSQSGCGPDRNVASQRAKTAFSFNVACVSDGDSPSPGCCTVNEEATQGCLCR